MPEIAEVGKRISRVLAPDDSNIFGKVGTSGPEFEKALTGKKVIGSGRQGKYFWLLLDKPPHPVMHLGMTGWIHIRGQQTAYNRYEGRSKGDKDDWPPRFWKFQLETDSKPKVEVAFSDARRFGRVRLVDCAAEDIRKHSPLVENGPDPVVDKDVFTEEYLKTKMRKKHIPIKALLLDQAVISGIGNWVGDEIMYQAKLHPEQYCDDFDDSDIATLYNAVRYVCGTAVEKLGNSDEFPEDWLFKHRWGKGKKDAATTLPNGEKLTFITVGGRTSCVVPSIQKKRGRTTTDDAKEETDGTGKESKSQYFETSSKRKTSSKTVVEEQPTKKAKTPKAKAIKKVQDAPIPAPEPGRRRSTRLSATK
ncbi:hypothetical protein SLS62_002903 [Diatrype stigma]|uniref:Formamidopyrimidine-DNA glycosylase catalytic domain-containing protein n=1 Tax=Diatrype stigma TaxID=117547 RepID=A0AAN9YQC6_9PEZI